MEGCKKRINCKEIEDRITALPGNLMDHILNFLPIKDAIRTSVLSRRWRDCWTRLEYLNFDMSFYRQIEDGEFMFENIIDSILLCHTGPISRFLLSIYSEATESVPLDPTRWIMFLSKNGIEDLTINSNTSEFMRIPSRIFSCSGLKQLELHMCEIGPSLHFDGFSNLVSLSLSQVIISDDLLYIMISKSPLLEKLDLHFDEYLVGNPIVVNSPRLKILDFFCIYDARKLCLENCPKLTRASIQSELKLLENRSGKSQLHVFIEVLSGIKFLLLDGLALTSLSVGITSSRLPSTLQFLRNLVLQEVDIASAIQLPAVFCLIRSSPDLQSLEISVSYSFSTNHDEEGAQVVLKRQDKEGILSRLSTIKIRGELTGSAYEILFVDTILSLCPMLKTVMLETLGNVQLHSNFMQLQIPESATLQFIPYFYRHNPADYRFRYGRCYSDSCSNP